MAYHYYTFENGSSKMYFAFQDSGQTSLFVYNSDNKEWEDAQLEETTSKHTGNNNDFRRYKFKDQAIHLAVPRSGDNGNRLYLIFGVGVTEVPQSLSYAGNYPPDKLPPCCSVSATPKRSDHVQLINTNPELRQALESHRTKLQGRWFEYRILDYVGSLFGRKSKGYSASEKITQINKALNGDANDFRPEVLDQGRTGGYFQRSRG